MKIKEYIIPQNPYPVFITLLNNERLLDETISSETTKEE
jgi:hypothetical protein